MKYMFTIVSWLLLSLLYTNCHRVLAKYSKPDRSCEVSEWSPWDTRSVIGCGTVTRSRTITREGRDCPYELAQFTQKCVRPSAFATAKAIGQHFLKKFSPTARIGRIGDVSPPPADLLFVIDKSSSIGTEHFATVIDHVKDLINLLPVPVATDRTRVGVISFSSHDKVDLDFDFNACDDKWTCSELVDQVDFTGGLTYTTKALNKAREEAFTDMHGSRANADKLLFLITDGRSNDHGDIVGAANALKDAGTAIFAVGITNKVDESELRSIVSEPINEHLFYYSNFQSMRRGGSLLQIMFN